MTCDPDRAPVALCDLLAGGGAEPSALERTRLAQLAAFVSSATADEDGCHVRRAGTGPPPSPQPTCPRCDGSWTWWRGPRPRVAVHDGRASTPDPPLDRGRLMRPRRDAHRPDEALRLWRLADRGKETAEPVGGGAYELWQAALCQRCEPVAAEEWLEAAWPTPPAREPGADGSGGWR